MQGPTEKGTCIVIGEESLLVECCQHLLDRDYRIAAIISGNEQIAAWAARKGLTIAAPERDLAAVTGPFDYDWFFSIANLRMLPESVFRKARRGAFNFHDGPLPRYAGLNAPAWAIMAGETAFGVTWHAICSQADMGGVYVRKPVEIAPDETALTLNAKCFEAGIASFAELVGMIDRGILEAQPQDLAQRTYFPKNARPRAAAAIDFSTSADEIGRLCRALDFGPNYANPLCLPKLWTRTGAFNILGISVENTAHGGAGQVISLDAGSALIACSGGAIRIHALSDAAGNSVPPGKIMTAGEMLPRLPDNLKERIDSLIAANAQHESYFLEKLRNVHDLELYGVKPADESAQPAIEAVAADLPGGLAGHRAAAAIVAALARMSTQTDFDLAFCDDNLARASADLPGFIAPSVPLRMHVAEQATAAALAGQVERELTQLAIGQSYPADLISRTPGLQPPSCSVALRLTGNAETARAVGGAALTFIIPAEGGGLRVLFDRNRIEPGELRAILKRTLIAAAAFASEPNQPLAGLPLMLKDEETQLLIERNKTSREYDRAALVHTLIEQQTAATPRAVALAAGALSLTYAELGEKADAVAHALIKAGAGPDKPIGIYMHRSVDLVVGVLGIMKSGAAYVPLDPAYPADRLQLMIEDSGLEIVLTQNSLAGSVPAEGQTIIAVEDASATLAVPSPAPERASPENLAYVIYTSGSTGRPKGVMVEHRNVVNFFAAMDDRIPMPQHAEPVWLAVTSLSFDISVLELLWTLTRGFKVVIHVDTKHGENRQPRRRTAAPAGGLDFSLFFWGHDDTASANKYKLLLESARFADAHGFRAVWTPERHFHAFGGPYPNPAVTGAAVAAITQNLEIRAGSCVLPLHHPARVAEEWAVIDNITGGRAALAFAAGWMPEDFVLRPDNAPPHNKTAMLRDIEIVRRLWRGETVTFEAAPGKPVTVLTQPRPVQRELPVWITTAGNPETYRDAARLGANVLTHLLGQSIAELGEKIQIYRKALLEAGRNPAGYKVTLMLHTLIGADREDVREIARQPMKDYLRSAAALIKQYAWAFPAFKKPQGAAQPMDIDLQTLDEDEMDAITEFAFLRYFDDSGFFGTVDDAIARADELKAIGVDEIACLVDYGISHDTALNALEPLAEVVATVNAGSAPLDDEALYGQDYGIAALIGRHGVTHLQCTPSMAAMLLLNDDDRKALHSVSHLFIGGEALQGTLLRDLRQATSASIENMYGPTETTIWSSTAKATERDTASTVPLGAPVANTQLYILDRHLRPVPPGLPGELFIGGDGVTRGYLNREALTGERFLDNPFIPGARIYRTGDLVRIGLDGEIHFIGRADHQVKVRGYRIELGEIEARLGLHPGVAEAVVAAREDKPNDVRIVAYLRYKDGPVEEKMLADHVRAALPDFMVPAHFVTMEKFPLTPNAKVDRNALPRPGEKREETPAIEFILPCNAVQEQIAEAFKRALGVEKVGALDNFFALGGHSLLAVQVHRDLKKHVAPQLSITDLYRFPTVSGLASHIQGGDQPNKELGRAADRAAMRRNAMAGRRSFAARARETS